MKYYVITIEQIKGESEGTYTEYGKCEQKADEQTALTAFYKKLSDVAAALGKTHTFMDIRILDSEGKYIKGDSIGAYVEVNQ